MAKAEIIKNILPEFEYYKRNLINNNIDKNEIFINLESDTDTNSDTNSITSTGYDYFYNILKERKENNNIKRKMKKYFIK